MLKRTIKTISLGIILSAIFTYSAYAESEIIPDVYIVKFDTYQPITSLDDITVIETYPKLGLAAIESTELNIDSLIARGELISAVPVRKYYSEASDPNISLLSQNNLVNSSLEGVTGIGTSIVIIDTGVDAHHPAFLNPTTGESRIVREACFSNISGTAVSICPDGTSTDTTNLNDIGSATPCSIAHCDHGTHVAGIAAAGEYTYNGKTIRGVAPDANIIAIQVFSRDDSDPASPTLFTTDIELIAAYEYLARLVDYNTLTVAAINMSLGTDTLYTNTEDCDNDYGPVPGSDSAGLAAAVHGLENRGVPTIAAAGNRRTNNGVSGPACISGVISVSNSTDNDTVAFSASVGGLTSIFAPGVNVYSTIPGIGIASKSGSSMSSPHVAGVFALLKSITPKSTPLQTITQSILTSGPQVSDIRIISPEIIPSSNPISRRRIDAPASLITLNTIIAKPPEIEMESSNELSVIPQNISFTVRDDIALGELNPTVVSKLNPDSIAQVECVKVSRLEKKCTFTVVLPDTITITVMDSGNVASKKEILFIHTITPPVKDSISIRSGTTFPNSLSVPIYTDIASLRTSPYPIMKSIPDIFIEGIAPVTTLTSGNITLNSHTITDDLIFVSGDFDSVSTLLHIPIGTSISSLGDFGAITPIPNPTIDQGTTPTIAFSIHTPNEPYTFTEKNPEICIPNAESVFGTLDTSRIFIQGSMDSISWTREALIQPRVSQGSLCFQISHASSYALGVIPITPSTPVQSSGGGGGGGGSLFSKINPKQQNLKTPIEIKREVDSFCDALFIARSVSSQKTLVTQFLQTVHYMTGNTTKNKQTLMKSALAKAFKDSGYIKKVKQNNYPGLNNYAKELCKRRPSVKRHTVSVNQYTQK